MIVGTLKVGPAANVPNVFLLNTALLVSLDYFLQLNTLCYILQSAFWWLKHMCSFIDMGIRCKTIEYRETLHALNHKEKIGLKLGLGKCAKTKVFLTLRDTF